MNISPRATRYIFLATFAIAACALIATSPKNQAGPSPISPTDPLAQAPAAGTTMPAEGPRQALPTHGIAQEVLTAGAYTIASLQDEGRTFWVALPRLELRPGEFLRFSGTHEVSDFKSRSLNRSFPRILFANKARVVAAGPENERKRAGSRLVPPSREEKVLQVLNASGYTILEVQSGAGRRWVALPRTKVKVGDIIAVGGAAPMKDFYSKTLDRTFPMIYFTGALRHLNGDSSQRPQPLPRNHPPLPGSGNGGR